MSTSALDSSLAPFLAQAGWYFSLYPEAGEGGGSFRSAYKPKSKFVAKGAAADPERAAAEAGRRAGANLRRYCAANRLNRLGTLTYAGSGCHDPQELRLHVAEFFRDLRSGLGGNPLPYAWVPEWHPKGHGLHVHFAAGRYIHRSMIKSAWGRGFVHIKLLSGLPVGSGELSEDRKAAGYLSKYVSKSFTDPRSRTFGLHRYDVAQGFQSVRLALNGHSPSDVLAQASEYLNGPPVTQWSSASTEDWAGPPTIWAQWGA